jgi:hypothetical protein
VLVDFIDESDLSKGGEIADVRKYIHANPPERSRSYQECWIGLPRDRLIGEWS